MVIAVVDFVIICSRNGEGSKQTSAKVAIVGRHINTGKDYNYNLR